VKLTAEGGNVTYTRHLAEGDSTTVKLAPGEQLYAAAVAGSYGHDIKVVVTDATPREKPAAKKTT
jgi:hypothetical protein